MRYTGHLLFVGCPPPSAPDTHASASPRSPSPSTTRSPRAQPLLLLLLPLPSHRMRNPRLPSRSLPPSTTRPQARVPCRSSPLVPAGGVSAGDPSGGGFLLGKDAIQLSSALRAVAPFCDLKEVVPFVPRARGILIVSL